MAQLVARLTGGQEAVSSSLATRTIPSVHMDTRIFYFSSFVMNIGTTSRRILEVRRTFCAKYSFTVRIATNFLRISATITCLYLFCQRFPGWAWTHFTFRVQFFILPAYSRLWRVSIFCSVNPNRNERNSFRFFIPANIIMKAWNKTGRLARYSWYLARLPVYY